MNKFYKKYGQIKDVILPPPPEDGEFDVIVPPESNRLPDETELPTGKEYEDKFYYYKEPEEDPQKNIKTNPEGLKKLLEQEVIDEEDKLSSDDLLAMCSSFYDLVTK